MADHDNLVSAGTAGGNNDLLPETVQPFFEVCIAAPDIIASEDPVVEQHVEVQPAPEQVMVVGQAGLVARPALQRWRRGDVAALRERRGA